MKLATYRDGSRDGQLVVVSSDLSLAHYASGVAGCLQQVLDDWNFLSPQLEDLASTLNHGKARHAFAFEPQRCMAPLPRAYQWVDGSAYLSHIERLRRARGAALPDDLQTVPLLYQGSSDAFLGPCDDIVAADESLGIDLGAELAVITGELRMGSSAEAAIEAVRLLVLVNDVTLRELVPAEVMRGFGLVQSKPATAFGPVAVTPDELGSAWRGGRAHLTLDCRRNGQAFGHLDTGAGMHFHFGQLLAHRARTRGLGAGSLVGGGTVSSADAADGFACIAERRAAAALEGGSAAIDYLRFGDTLRIDATDGNGASVFGAIEQRVSAAAA
jgi:fumarylacetoacetate (FAA) hydrolase